MPGAFAIQTFGDFLGFHPHLHILVSDGCFHANGMFYVSPAIDTKTLEQIFRYKVLKVFIRLGWAPSPKFSRTPACALHADRSPVWMTTLSIRTIQRKRILKNLARADRLLARAKLGEDRLPVHKIPP